MKVARVLLLSFFAVLPTVARQREPAPAARRDVFLITIDTLRADHVHCYGYASGQTPGLDQLAKDGVRFAQAFTPSPITTPSHVSILTGLLPSAHGVVNFGVPLNSAHPTMAALLKVQGYQTAAFIGAVVLDSKTLAPGLDRGFDFYDHFPPASKNSSRWGRVERRGKDVVAHAEKWMEAHRSGPRFVWVHLYDPHDPYDPPSPYDKTFHDRLYDGEIAYADSALGDFVAYLKKNAWYDSALIVVVGDHGEGLGEHNEETHGIFLYDSTTHVPLIVKLPGRASAGRTIDQQVSTTDILPSVLDELDVKVKSPTDGHPFKSLLKLSSEGAQGMDPLPAFGETAYPMSFGWAPLYSVRDKGFKFIDAPQPEFYDLHSDPGELHSIYQPWNPELQKLREELAALREKYPERTSKSSAGTVGNATTQELQALGYLGPADALSSSTVAEPSLLPDPKDKIAEQNLLHTAMLAVDDNHPGEARSSLEKVLELDGKSIAALTQLGQLELTDKNYEKAGGYLERAYALRPDDSNLALSLGEALRNAGDLRGAERALQASLKTNPNQYAARFQLGVVYCDLRRFAAAQDQLEAALLIQPTFEAELKLGELFLTQTRFKEAADQLEAATKTQHDSARAYELLAQAFEGLGNNVRAQQARSRARALSAREMKQPE
ncbi:MAG TPA: sulfatase-like hydrolase/transferase [Candidatus Acidoferrum sp.]